MKQKTLATMAMLAFLLVLLVPLPVAAQASQSYASYLTGDDAYVAVDGTSWYAQTFTPTAACTVDTVKIKVYAVGTPGTLIVSLRAVDGTGKPTGADLTSNTLTGIGGTASWYSVSLPEYTLDTSQYALVLSCPSGDGSNYVAWRYDSSSPTYSDGSYASSADSGNSWTLDTGKDFMFSIWGTAALSIINAQVFTGYLEPDDWLITVYYHNEYPPYYSLYTASDCFQFELLNGNTTVASVRMQQWGNMPGSIYLSKESASSLQWGSYYTVRLACLFSPYSHADWVLSPSDWLGSDLRRLDKWVISTADSMAAYYTTSSASVQFTGYTNNVKVLNDEGSVFFATGVPMLATVRPNVFFNPSEYSPVSETGWQRPYEESVQWQDAVGSQIVNDANTVGNTFGLTGQQVAQAAFFGLWVVASLGAAAVIGGDALVVSLPFILIGGITRIIPLTAFIIVACIFGFLLVYWVWIRGTS
jgi:hypothetical protein